MTLAGKEKSAYFGPDRTDSVFKKGPTSRGTLFGALEVRGCHFWALISMPLMFEDVKVRSSGFGLGLSFDQKKLKA